VVVHHGDLVLPRGTLNRLFTRVLLGSYRLLARRAAAFVCHTEDYARQSVYLSPTLDRLAVIHPPIEMPPPRPDRVRALRAAWGPGPAIGFAGRFVEEKRPDLLLRALDVVRERLPAAHIVFAGQHQIPYEDYWRRHAALVERQRPHLVFLGVLGDAQSMADYYAACDVLALPSDTECFALVQVEAMLSGTPVVMTDAPGGRMPVRETGMGVLVERGDWRALGAGLLEVLSDPGRYVRPREEIAARYSIDDTIDRYEQLLRRVSRRG
jgi:glycosyltransferase involved in cell wall biosynthesis